MKGTRFLGIFGAGLAALLVFASPALAGSVTGIVRDARNNTPLLGMQVRLMQLAGQNWVEGPSATTNVNGMYTIAGSDASVSDGVASTLGVPPAGRLSGANRELTAIAIAQLAAAQGWLDDKNFAIAANVPDALAAGPVLGKLNGPVLLTRAGATSLSPATFSYLSFIESGLELGIVCGGPTVISDNVRLTTQSAVN